MWVSAALVCDSTDAPEPGQFFMRNRVLHGLAQIVDPTGRLFKIGLLAATKVRDAEAEQLFVVGWRGRILAFVNAVLGAAIWGRILLGEPEGRRGELSALFVQQDFRKKVSVFWHGHPLAPVPGSGFAFTNQLFSGCFLGSIG